MTSSRFLSVVGAFALFIGACGGQDGGTSTGSGGTTGTGGASSSGGSSGTGTGGTAGSPGTGGSRAQAARFLEPAVRPLAGAAPVALRLAEAPAQRRRAEVPEAASAAVPSKGCGVTDGAKTLTTGGMSVMNALPTSTRLKITSGGMSREYIIDIPADYDPTHPYRLIFSWHQAYGSDTGNANGLHPAGDGPNFDATDYAFFGLRREATAANQPAIFVAPGGIGNLPWDFKRDAALFDDLLALVDANLCIDDSRVFSTGFSFGAMMSYALSITRQTKLRGGGRHGSGQLHPSR